MDIEQSYGSRIDAGSAAGSVALFPVLFPIDCGTGVKSQVAFQTLPMPAAGGAAKRGERFAAKVSVRSSKQSLQRRLES
jgi:hypothetical protein